MRLAGAIAGTILGFSMAAMPGTMAQTIDDLSSVENNPKTKPPTVIIPPPPLTPRQSQDSILVRPGFKVELFASEPEVKNPFAMVFDHRGRLWVAEAMDYPHTQTTDPFMGGDRIKILEDTNGDGKADLVTVFAEGLNQVTGLALVPEGVVVGMAPHIVLMVDANGDDKADTKKILYSGFGRGDTHGVLSSFQYGMDDWVYGTVGLAGLQLEPLGRVLNGMFRFKADGTKLEWVGNFPNNSWGLGFNEAGQIFGSTANGQHSVYAAIPDRYYQAAELPPRTAEYHSNSTSRGVVWSLDHFIMEPVTKSVLKVDFLTEFTASTNAEVYTAREFPKEYWNRATFACEPTGHLCHIDWQEPKGSEYTAKTGRNFFASRDPWTAPIAAKTGPKGELYVMDWYDPIIQHNCWASGQSCGTGSAYTSTHRDNQYGRIWRVSYAAATPAAAPDLREGTLNKLVAALKHPNMVWRMNAQRLLIAKHDKAAIPLLAALLSDGSMDEAGINGGVAHALWTLGHLGAFAIPGPMTQAAYSLAFHPSHAVRMALLDAMPRTQASVDAITASGLLYDKNPQVRLKAMLALTEMPKVAGPIKVVIAHKDLDRLSKDAYEMLAKAHATQLVNEAPPTSVIGTPLPSTSGFRQALYVRGRMVSLPAQAGMSVGTFHVYDQAGRKVARMPVAGPDVALPFRLGKGIYRYAFSSAGGHGAGNGFTASGPLISMD